MVIVTLQREKCIGCGYCVEAAGEFFSMSERDGKSTLKGAVEKKGFYTLRTGDETSKDPLGDAAANCPVRIIKVSGGVKP